MDPPTCVRGAPERERERERGGRAGRMEGASEHTHTHTQTTILPVSHSCTLSQFRCTQTHAHTHVQLTHTYTTHTHTHTHTHHTYYQLAFLYFTDNSLVWSPWPSMIIGIERSLSRLEQQQRTRMHYRHTRAHAPCLSKWRTEIT